MWFIYKLYKWAEKEYRFHFELIIDCLSVFFSITAKSGGPRPPSLRPCKFPETKTTIRSKNILFYTPFQTSTIVLSACVICLGTRSQNWNVDTSSIVHVLIPGFSKIEHALIVEIWSILHKSILSCKEEGPTKWLSRSFQVGIKGVKESFTHYLSS